MNRLHRAVLLPAHATAWAAARWAATFPLGVLTRGRVARRVRDALPDAIVSVRRMWWGAPVVTAEWSVAAADYDFGIPETLHMWAAWVRPLPWLGWRRVVAAGGYSSEVTPRRRRHAAGLFDLQRAVRSALAVHGLEAA